MKPRDFWWPAALCFVVFFGLDRGSTPLELHHRGIATLYRHDFVAAERIFAELVRRVPESSVAWVNLGIAQLNQAESGVDRAVVSLQYARKLDGLEPRIPYCLGIIHRFRGDSEPARRELELALQLAPEDPDVHYQYGLILSQSTERERALGHFEAARTRNPRIIGVWNNLYRLYRVLGQDAEAADARTQFELLKSSGRGLPRGLRFTEMGALAEAILDWPGWHGTAAVPIRFAEPVEIPGATGPFAAVDHDLDGLTELWCAGEYPGRWNLAGEPRSVGELPALGEVSGFAVGDVDEDGRPDLVTVNADREVRWHSADAGRGTFGSGHSVPGPAGTRVRLVDLDLEGDLDLITWGSGAVPAVGINTGRDFGPFDGPPGPFTEVGLGARLWLACDLDGDAAAELVFEEEGTLQVVENAPQWRFTLRPTPLPFGTPVWALDAADLDGDGDLDLVATGPGGGVALNDGKGRFTRRDSPEVLRSSKVVRGVDVDLDGAVDLLVTGPQGGWVLRNDGRAHFEPTATLVPPATALVAADLDGDHDFDLVLRDPEGRIAFVRNVSALPHGSRCIRLGGARDESDRRTNLLGLGARVVVRAGSLTTTAAQRGSLGGDAQGSVPVIVGLGRRSHVDSIFVYWPDGVVQAEGELPNAPCLRIDEVQRKSSSCPILFTWDGEKHRFVTDFMGGGGLGFWVGWDRYGRADPTETVRIPPGALRPENGELRLSVMEPMEEVCYVDALGLLAVDHPVTVDVYPDELFATGAVVPTGRPLAFERGQRVFPTSVRDGANRDLTEQVLARDRDYAGSTQLDPDLMGYAAAQTLVLEFADGLPDGLSADGDVHLFLTGWVEYPYSRVNFAAHQGGRALSPPSFSWRRSSSEPWRSWHQEVGYPAGMPKTMVLDLGEIARAGARHIRIATNMEIYWDCIFAAPVLPPHRYRVRELALSRAVLRFGGYPREYSDDGRLPATYHYEERDPYISFKPMPGRITAEGRVEPLIGAVDDHFAILGGGDELRLVYSAPDDALPAGWTRTFLLETHGYCKDRDPLTAQPDSVEPLPFGAMEVYPPRFPGPPRGAYRALWNTRSDR